MIGARQWAAYHVNYRADQMQTIAQWIASGTSCAVVGLAGCGKSNLLGFLSHKPQVLDPYVGGLADHIIPIAVDLNSLPTRDLSTLFRVMLRAFYESRHTLSPEAQELITQQYLQNRAATDPFLPQSALRELLWYFQAQQQQIVFVMDRFDRFADNAPEGMSDTLRNFRDSFKGVLSYVVGMRQSPKYILNPDDLGELYEILDLHICWVGPMNLEDARRVMSEELRIPESELDEALVERIYGLTGGYPSLLKAVCQRYLIHTADWPHLEKLLLEDRNVRYRISEIWRGFTQQEQVILYTLAQGKPCQASDVVTLLEKGLITHRDDGYIVGSALLKSYALTEGKLSRGTLWRDEKTQVLYQGTAVLDVLTPIEAALLSFFIEHPYKKHSYTDIITAVWPDDENMGVSNENLSKQISNLRKQIEPDYSKPIYIINFRGKPEGGYQFFPEGKPA